MIIGTILASDTYPTDSTLIIKFNILYVIKACVFVRKSIQNDGITVGLKRVSMVLLAYAESIGSLALSVCMCLLNRAKW